MNNLTKKKALVDPVAHEQHFLTETQLAHRWLISTGKLQNDRVSGNGAPFVKFGGAVRYLISDVETFEEAARKMSTS